MWFVIIHTSLLIAFTHASSWLECTNYDPPSIEAALLGGFDRARCHGYPRNFHAQYAGGFGVDTQYQWARADCARDKYNPADYTPVTPMATYTAGETVYLIHPSKTYVADVCTNSMIPTESVKLFISSNITTDTFDIELSVVGGDHVNGRIDHLGYQRCFDFCGNIDKATCLTGWKLPRYLSSGIHSFRWTWEIIPGLYYSTCFDANVISVDFEDNVSTNSNRTKVDDIVTPTATVPHTIVSSPDSPSPTAAVTPKLTSKPEVITNHANAIYLLNPIVLIIVICVFSLS